jgi:murein DD-endopeptidase MepM/ murein hydrolase activator NlpD
VQGGGRGRLALLTPLLLVLLVAGCSIPRWPLDGTMTSPFGLRVRGGDLLPTVHHGVDLRVPTGTPVHAVLPGEVRFAGVMRGYGQVIWLEHRGGALTVYAHLSEIRVRVGERIGGRQVIGLSGQSGNASRAPPPLRSLEGGRPVDPVQALGRRPRPTGR